jgi:hypothetical protein
MFLPALITREHIAYNHSLQLMRPKRPQAPKLALVRTIVNLRVNRVKPIFYETRLAAPRAAAPRMVFCTGKDPRIHQTAAAKK